MPHGCSGCASTGFHVTSRYRFNVQVATDRAGIARSSIRFAHMCEVVHSDFRRETTYSSLESRKKDHEEY